MNNSERIEKATREHVNAVLTSQQIQELVKTFDPTNQKGVYPSDVAGKLAEDGKTITHRGKVPYGDLVLLQLSSNSYRVLPTDQIVRRKNPTVAPAAPPAPPAPAAEEPQKTQPVKKSKAQKAA